MQCLIRLFIIIIIIIIIPVITFMQGIYNYVLETNHISKVHSVAAVLYLHFVVHVMLFRSCSMSCTLALSVVCVQCSIRLLLLFLNLVLSWYVLRYCLSGFEMVPVAPVIAGITFTFTFHIR